MNTKPQYLMSDVDTATTGKLREIFTAITGRPTVDRNKVKLKKRVAKLIAEQVAQRNAANPNEHAEAERIVNEVERRAQDPNDPIAIERRQSIEDRAAKQKEQGRRIADKLVKRMGARVPGRISNLSEMLKKGPVTMAVKGDPLDSRPARHGLAGMKARKVEKAKAARPKKSRVARVAKPPCAKKSRRDTNTRQVLAALKPGDILKHVFRQGDKQSFTVKCRVITPPDLDGAGGKFKYDGKTYGDLREVMRQTSNTNYNVLLFWGLAPWPKHKKREKAEG